MSKNTARKTVPATSLDESPFMADVVAGPLDVADESPATDETVVAGPADVADPFMADVVAGPLEPVDSGIVGAPIEEVRDGRTDTVTVTLPRYVTFPIAYANLLRPGEPKFYKLDLANKPATVIAATFRNGAVQKFADGMAGAGAPGGRAVPNWVCDKLGRPRGTVFGNGAGDVSPREMVETVDALLSSGSWVVKGGGSGTGTVGRTSDPADAYVRGEAAAAARDHLRATGMARTKEAVAKLAAAALANADWVAETRAAYVPPKVSARMLPANILAGLKTA